MENSSVGLSSRLKELRLERGLTQRQLSEAIDIGYGSIVDYENGRREPNSKAMVALERFFGVSGEYLRGEVSREEFLAKAARVEDGLDSLIQRFATYQQGFRIADQDRQLESTAAVEAALDYINDQLAQGSDAESSLQSFSALVGTFAGLEPHQAREVTCLVEAELAGSAPAEDELQQKYRQLDQRGQAAVMDTLRREYDYLHKPVNVPAAAFGKGKQVMLTSQAEEDRQKERLGKSTPPDDL